ARRPRAWSRALGVCAVVGFTKIAAAETSAAEAPTPPGLQAPTVVESQPPAYPPAAPAGARGDVAVTVDVDAEGNVVGVAVARGVQSALDRAALEAASHWR